jgi:hypothetical protein
METIKLRQLMNLCEGRDPDVEYQDNDSQVIAMLYSYKSQVYTKIVNLLEETEQLETQLKAKKDELKTHTREDIANMFDDSIDITKTRIIETRSAVLTLSKDPKPTEAPQYKNILDEIYKDLTPELQARVDLLKKTMVTVTQKSPSLKYKRLEEGVATSFFSRLRNYFMKWGQSYDQKLDKVKRMANAL